MKTVFALVMLFGLVMSQTPVPQANTMQTCVTSLKKAGDEVLQTTTKGLNGDVLGAFAEVMQAISDIKETATACKAINMNDALMYIDQHTGAEQKDCLSKVVGALMAVKTAEDKFHDATATTSDKMKAVGNVIGLLDGAWTQCLNKF